MDRRASFNALAARKYMRHLSVAPHDKCQAYEKPRRACLIQYPCIVCQRECVRQWQDACLQRQVRGPLELLAAPKEVLAHIYLQSLFQAAAVHVAVMHVT